MLILCGPTRQPGVWAVASVPPPTNLLTSHANVGASSSPFSSQDVESKIGAPLRLLVAVSSQQQQQQQQATTSTFSANNNVAAKTNYHQFAAMTAGHQQQQQQAFAAGNYHQQLVDPKLQQQLPDAYRCPTAAGGRVRMLESMGHSSSEGSVVGDDSDQSSNGDAKSGGKSSKNRLYKTELCRQWMEHRRCNYGERCQYAHGEHELRETPRHPKYKTEQCRTFHNTGYCPYGPRCHFKHGEDHVPAPQPPKQTASKPVCVAQPLSVSTVPQPHWSMQPQSIHGLPSNSRYIYDQPEPVVQRPPMGYNNNNKVVSRPYTLPGAVDHQQQQHHHHHGVPYGSTGDSPIPSSSSSCESPSSLSYSPSLPVTDTTCSELDACSPVYMSPLQHQLPAYISNAKPANGAGLQSFETRLNNMAGTAFPSCSAECGAAPVERVRAGLDQLGLMDEESLSALRQAPANRLPVFARLSNQSS